jgi:hypothetical protein
MRHQMIPDKSSQLPVQKVAPSMLADEIVDTRTKSRGVSAKRREAQQLDHRLGQLLRKPSMAVDRCQDAVLAFGSILLMPSLDAVLPESETQGKLSLDAARSNVVLLR